MIRLAPGIAGRFNARRAWLSQTTQTQGQFIGTKGYSYTFRIKATDNVSNTTANWQVSQPVTINAVTKYYTHGGQRVAMRQGDMVYYLHGDHLGSTSLTTDETGTPVAETRYLPYGEERWTSDTAQPTDFTFTGQRAEAGFGLMDYNARYYSTRLGRFVSPDSIVPDPSSSSGFNRYAYVMNNPVRFSDPTGHGGGVGTLSPPLQIPWQNLEKIGPPLAVSAPEALVVGTMAIGLGTDAYIGSMWAMQDMGPAYPGNPWTGGVELIDPHPLIDVTTPLPGTDTIGSNLETITPPDVETPFELPGPSPEIEGSNTVLDFPTFDEPGLIPPVLAANNPWFEKIYYNGTPFGRQDSQRLRNRDLLRDLAEEYPHIKSKEWQKVEQWFEYEGEDYDLHWAEARDIVERGKVDP